MAKIKVDRDIKEALDGLIYKNEVYVSDAEVDKRSEEIIRCHAKGPWNGYKQLNRLTLLELTRILHSGYECEPTPEEKLVKSYLSNKETAEFYEDKNDLHKSEIRQEGYSRGYVSAFEDLLQNDIHINTVIRLLNKEDA